MKMPMESFNENLSILCFQAIFLSRKGGTDVKDAAERVLSSLMTNDLALLYNWAGKKFKERLQKLPIRSTGVPAVVCSKF